jgi:hypothetical protein
MKIRSSWKAAAVGVASIAAVVAAWTLYSEQKLKDFELTPIKPDQVNLIAIDPGKGFRVIVANKIAQLSEVEGGGGLGEDRSGSNLRRIPIRELMRTFEGDEEALGILIEKMNKIDPSELPREEYYWTEEELRLALSGEDDDFAIKLEEQIHVRLDGRPLGEINLDAIYSGIAITSKVPVEVNIAGERKTLYGPVRRHFESELAKQMQAKLEDTLDPSVAFITGQYLAVTLPLIEEPNRREDVRASLGRFVDSRGYQSLAASPQRILDSANVIINSTHIESAELKERVAGRNKVWEIKITLTEEGRMRLWKYSRERLKQNYVDRALGKKSSEWFQVMLIVNGVAIQAPVFTSELAERSFTITQMQDGTVAADSVESINRYVGK